MLNNRFQNTVIATTALKFQDASCVTASCGSTSCIDTSCDIVSCVTVSCVSASCVICVMWSVHNALFRHAYYVMR